MMPVAFELVNNGNGTGKRALRGRAVLVPLRYTQNEPGVPM